MGNRKKGLPAGGVALEGAKSGFFAFGGTTE